MDAERDEEVTPSERLKLTTKRRRAFAAYVAALRDSTGHPSPVAAAALSEAIRRDRGNVTRSLVELLDALGVSRGHRGAVVELLAAVLDDATATDDAEPLTADELEAVASAFKAAP